MGATGSGVAVTGGEAALRGLTELQTLSISVHPERLVALRPPSLSAASHNVHFVRDALETRHQQLLDDWQCWRITNFDYLMRLNTLAGRSFNDLTQYPVVPWVIKDYASSNLDLTNPASFRDLTKPIGAQEPAQAARFAERYAEGSDCLECLGVPLSVVLACR